MSIIRTQLKDEGLPVVAEDFRLGWRGHRGRYAIATVWLDVNAANWLEWRQRFIELFGQDKVDRLEHFDGELLRGEHDDH